MTLRTLFTAISEVFHHPESQAAEAPEERRGPNARMGALLYKANVSEHFTRAAIQRQTAKAMAQREKVA